MKKLSLVKDRRGLKNVLKAEYQDKQVGKPFRDKDVDFFCGFLKFKMNMRELRLPI